MANQAHGTGNLGRLKYVFRELKFKLAPLLAPKTYEICIKAHLNFYLKYSVTTTEVPDKRTAYTNVVCNQRLV